MLSRISQSQKSNAIWFHPHEESQSVRIIERAMEMEDGEFVFNGYRVSDFHEKVLESVAKQCKYA